MEPGVYTQILKDDWSSGYLWQNEWFPLLQIYVRGHYARPIHIINASVQHVGVALIKTQLPWIV